jgi:uncharacterized protein
MIMLSEMVESCAKQMHAALTELEKNGATMQHCIEINRIENEADRIGRSAVADLFNNEKDPIRVIKLKEVFDYLEATIDNCEDVADVLQNVVVKNS